MEKKRSVGVIIAIILILGAFLGYTIFDNRIVNLKNKKALVAIMDNLLLGDEKVKVREIYNQYKTNTLELVELENSWLIRMPHEFGATDWVVWIGFENNKIISLKIRLSDSKEMKPKNSPPDKIIERSVSTPK